MFISGNEDFIKKLGDKTKYNFPEIFERYQGMFPINNSETINELAIMDSEMYLKHSLNKLETFEILCKKNAISYENYIHSLEGSINGLSGINESYKKYGNEIRGLPRRSNFSNQFNIILEWARAEMLDFQAYIDIISIRNEFIKICDKLNEKIEKERKNLAKIQSGKKTLSQILTKKSSDNHMTDIEGSIQEVTKEQEITMKIVEIITFRLVNIYLPGFRQDNIKNFSRILTEFISMHIQEIESLSRQSAEISDIYSEN